jgi:hypothetical protein
MALHDGERLWFACVDEVADIRTFNLYRLTPERQAYEDHWHAEFVRHVGTNYTYAEHDKFYIPYAEAKKDAPPGPDGMQAVAWFDDAPALNTPPAPSRGPAHTPAKGDDEEG